MVRKDNPTGLSHPHLYPLPFCHGGQALGEGAIPCLRILISVLCFLAFGCGRSNVSSYFDGVFEVSKETEIRLLGRVPAEVAYREKIGSLTRQIEKGFSPSASANEKIVRLNSFLFEEWGLVPDTVGEDVASSCLTRVLDERRGSCVGITALYLCLGEQLNLPLQAVLVSGHVFVRYAADGANLNIETLRKGIPRSDSFYQEHFCGVDTSSCLRDLSKREFLGVCYFNLGNAYRKFGFFEDAAHKYKKVMEYFPEFREAEENLNQTRKIMANRG